MRAPVARILALFLFVVVCSQAVPGASGLAASPKRSGPAETPTKARQLSAPDLSPPLRVQPLGTPATLPDRLRGIIRRVSLPAGDRRIALSFDLCERAVHVTGYDAALVDALRRENAHATFFAGGKWMRSHPEATLALMADERFELGNHAWTHANMAVVQGNRREEQVLWTSAQAELLREELDRRLARAGKQPMGPRPLALFRLPYGRGGADTATFLNNQGLAVIQWDVVGEGGRGAAQARARAIAEAVRPGSIVLLHANLVPRDSASVVRALLPLLRQRGYTTATVGELLAAGAPETVSDGYFSIPGDNRIYDDMFLDAGTGGRARADGADGPKGLLGRKRLR
ncbi:MAG: xylanase [Desulfovibrio sp.]|nr:xylanase [Desulfovibrio sp.]